MGGGMLYKTEQRINDYITVRIPTVGEIINHDGGVDDYYNMVSLIVSTPYDMIAQLDEAGIDFTEIDCWDLFCILYKELKGRDLSLLFKDLNFDDFEPAINQQNGDVVLINMKTGAIIDREAHRKICEFLCKILNIEVKDKRPGNEEAKKYMIDRAKRKLKIARRKSNANNTDESSQLEQLIIALVNTSEFSYNYNTVLDLTIYQFNASLRQIIKKVRYDNLMIGCYAGAVDMNDINQNELDWITIN